VATFVDTSGLYAVLDAADPNHANAALAWIELLDRGEAFITTNYVVVETVALLQSRHGFAAARRLVEDVLPVLEVVWIDEALHATSFAAWLAAARRSLSVVDCASFAVMRARGVRRAFAFDQHFDEQGFVGVTREGGAT
jgi:predicted nucleic acid-binding protein